MAGRRVRPRASNVQHPHIGSLRRANSVCGPTSAVDEDTFQKSFEDVPPVRLFSSRDVVEHMKGILETISDASKDWNKRVDALKKVRATIIAGGANYIDFHTYIKRMKHPLQKTCKDLRSQVVREACITIAHLAQTLRNKFEHIAECLLSTIINLIQNSAKIVATSGLICVRFIIRNCQSSRLIPIVTSNLATSKSKDTRRSCCEFLEQMLTQWPTHHLKRHIVILQDAIKRGIADADPNARVISRKAFRGFKEHFPDRAEVLFQSLEPSYRRALQGELCSSSSSSSGSLAQTGADHETSSRQSTTATSRSASPSAEGSTCRSHDGDSPRPCGLFFDIPCSTTGSRDTSKEMSPRCTPSVDRYRKPNDRLPICPATILQPSRQAENALAEAVTVDQIDGNHLKNRLNSPRKDLRPLENHSDDSEISSVCSEHLFGSYRQPSDVYTRLWKTSAPTQNYNYETLGPKLDREKKTISWDFGISQTSSVNDVKPDAVALEATAEESPPNSGYAPEDAMISNGYDSIDDFNGKALIEKVLELCIVDNPIPITEKRKYLSKLGEMIKNGNTEHVVLNFKKLLSLLLDQLRQKDPPTEIIVLRTMTEIFNKPVMKPCWSNFVESLIVYVLNVHCQEKQEVAKEVEVTAAAMSVFPLNAVIKVLAVLIETPAALIVRSTIRMLIKVVESHRDQITNKHLTQIMPGLVAAAEHEAVIVRMSAFLCMVAFHKAIGEERLTPHISKLCDSKQRLLQMYIERAQQSSRVPTSPKNSAVAN